MPSCSLVVLQQNLHGLIKIPVLDVSLYDFYGTPAVDFVAEYFRSKFSYRDRPGEFPRCDENFGRLMELVKNTHASPVDRVRAMETANLVSFDLREIRAPCYPCLLDISTSCLALRFSRYISEFHSSTGSLKGRLLVLQYPLVDS